jgi:PEGA domain
MRRALFFPIVVVSILSFARPARAGAPEADRGEAAERFDRALRRVNAGDLSGGLAEFQRAYALQPSSVVLYNVGLVDAALNRPVEAARAIEKALANPETLKPENVQRARDVLREQIDKIGQVTLSTNVKEGVVEIDNVEVAKLPLAGPLDVASGPHVVGVIAAGYAPARREILLAGKDRVETRLELVAIEGLLAHIAVSCRIPTADVFVDGERVGKTPLDATITVAPGTHQVEVRRAGYTTAARGITLQDGARGELTLNPTVDKDALGREGGWLAITASETLSVVSLDGDELGMLAGPILVPAGPHRLHVERGGFLAADRDVAVPLGGTTAVSIVFEPTPDTRAHYVSGAQSRRAWSWVTFGLGAAVAAGGVTLALVEQNQLPGAQSTLDAANADWVQGSMRACDHSQALSNAMLMTCDARLNDAANHVDNLRIGRTIGWVAAGVGGATMVAGAVLLLTGDNPHRYDERPPAPMVTAWRIVPLVGPGSFLASAAGSF